MNKMKTRMTALAMAAVLTMGMAGTTAFAAGNRCARNNAGSGVCTGVGYGNGVCDGSGAGSDNGVCDGTGSGRCSRR